MAVQIVRKTSEVYVYDMDGFFNTISNYDGEYADNTGNSIMANGATAVLAVGRYKCSEGTCASQYEMLATEDLHGVIKCEDDSASCLLDGENFRGVMSVDGAGADTLTLRALTFKDGEATNGGGVYIWGGAKVTIELCVFSNCRATESYYGGGAIFFESGIVNVYGTSFSGNTAVSGNGDDILQGDSGTITIHNTCPSPYSSNTPILGEFK